MFEVVFLEGTAEQLKNFTVPSVPWPIPHLSARNARILSVADSKPFISYSVAFPVVLVLLGGAFIILYFWYRKHQQLLTSRRRIAREVARHYTTMPNQDSLSRRKQEHLEALRIVKRMLEEHPSSKVLKSELHNTLTGLYHVEKLLYEAMRNPAAEEAPGPRNPYPPIRYTVDLNLQSLSASKHPSTVGSIAECTNRTTSPASTSSPSKVKSWSPALHTTAALAAFHIVDGMVEPANDVGDEGGPRSLASACQTARTVSLELSVSRGFEKRKNEDDVECEHNFWKKSKVAGADSRYGAPAPKSRKVSIQADESVVELQTASARSSLASDAGILGLAFASLLASSLDDGQSSQTADQVPAESEDAHAAEHIGESEVLPVAQDTGSGNLHEGTDYFDSSLIFMAGFDDANLSERRIASSEQNSMACEEVFEYGSSRLTGPGSVNWDWSSAGPEDSGGWSPLNEVIAERGKNSTPFAQTEQKRLHDLTEKELASTRDGSCFSNFRKVCYLCGDSSLPPQTVDQSSEPPLAEGSLELVTIENPLFVPGTGDPEMAQEESFGAEKTLPFFATLEQLFSRSKQMLFETKIAPRKSSVSRFVEQEITPDVSVHVDYEPKQSMRASVYPLPVMVSYEEGTHQTNQKDDTPPADVCICERSLQEHGVASGKQLKGPCYDCGKPRVYFSEGHWVCRNCGKKIARGRKFCACPEIQEGDHHVGSERAVHRDSFTQTSLWGAWAPSASEMCYPSEDVLVQQVDPTRGGGAALQMDEMGTEKPLFVHPCKEVQKSLHQQPRPSVEKESLPQSTCQNEHVVTLAKHVSHTPNTSRMPDERFAGSTTGLVATTRSPSRNWQGLSDFEVSSLSSENDCCSTENSAHSAQEMVDDLIDNTEGNHRESRGHRDAHPDLEYVGDEAPSGHPEGISLKNYVDSGKRKDQQANDRRLLNAAGRSPSGSSPRLSHTEVLPHSDESGYSSSNSSARGAQQEAAPLDDLRDNTKSSKSEGISLMTYIHDAVTTLVLPYAQGTHAGMESSPKESNVGSLGTTSGEVDDGTPSEVEYGTRSGHPEGISLADYVDKKGTSRVHVGEERKKPATRSSGCQTTFVLGLQLYTDESDDTCKPVLDTKSTDRPDYKHTSAPTATPIQNTDESSEAVKERLSEIAGDPPEEVLLRLLEEPLRSPAVEEHVVNDEAPPTPDAAKVILDVLEAQVAELGPIGCIEEGDNILNEEFPSSANQSGEASSELSQVRKLPNLEDGTIFAKKILAESSVNIQPRNLKVLQEAGLLSQDFLEKQSTPDELSAVDVSRVDAGMSGIKAEWRAPDSEALESCEYADQSSQGLEPLQLHGDLVSFHGDTARYELLNCSSESTRWDQVSSASELVASVARASTKAAEPLQNPSLPPRRYIAADTCKDRLPSTHEHPKEDMVADWSNCEDKPLNEQPVSSTNHDHEDAGASDSTLHSTLNTVDTAFDGRVPIGLGGVVGTFSTDNSNEGEPLSDIEVESTSSRLHDGKLDQEPALGPFLTDSFSKAEALQENARQELAIPEPRSSSLDIREARFVNLAHVEVAEHSYMGVAPEDCGAPFKSEDGHPSKQNMQDHSNHAVPKEAWVSVAQVPTSAGDRAPMTEMPTSECDQHEIDSDLQGPRESATYLPEDHTPCVRAPGTTSSVGSTVIGISMSEDADDLRGAPYTFQVKMQSSANHRQTVPNYFNLLRNEVLVGNYQNICKESERNKREGQESDLIVDLRDVYTRRRRHRRVEEPIASRAPYVVQISPAFNDDRHSVVSYSDPAHTSGFLEKNQEYRNLDQPGKRKGVDTVEFSITTDNLDVADVSMADSANERTPVLDLRELCERPVRYRTLQTKLLSSGIAVITNSHSNQRKLDTRECAARRNITSDKEQEQEQGQQENIIASELEGTFVRDIEQESCDFKMPLNSHAEKFRRNISVPTTLALTAVLSTGASDIKQKKTLAEREPWKFEKKFDMFSSGLDVLSSRHPPARTKAVRELEKVMKELQGEPPLRCFPALSRIKQLNLLNDKRSTSTGRALLQRSPSVPSNADLHRKKKCNKRYLMGM